MLLTQTQISSDHHNRRDLLMKSHPGAAFLFPANSHTLRNSDVHYPYRQESCFYYLTGFEEPDSYLVLSPTSKPGKYRTTLFLQPRDPEKEIWEGERYGVDGAIRVFGADEAYSIHELDKKLPELVSGAERLFYRMGLYPEQDRRIVSLLDTLRLSAGRSGRGFLPLEDSHAAVGEMRLFKSPAEIETMRKSCQISAKAHKQVMKETKPGMNERDVEALVDYVFRKEGCSRVGYGSIVAGGKNAACLHYRSNNETLREGDLLLIDAGGEFDYYSADITRTFPIGRSFSNAQAKAYQLVLKAQKEAIEMTKPGVTLVQIHQHVCEVLVDGLLSLGLMHGQSEEILKTREFRRFYPHSTSHWLGMDVHDLGLYQRNGEPRMLEPGMVFTIEPGFYVQSSDHQVPKEFMNIGIRIEDDILVTSNGCEVLTRDAPKEIHDLEDLRK